MKTGAIIATHARCSRLWAFTLIELLTVIAIIGVLATVLIPSMASARAAADRAKTRVQFSQWAVAVTAFRNEYGFYPVFDGSNLVNGGGDAVNHPFHDVLAGRRRDGSALVAGSMAAVQNKKLISFITFSGSDFAGSGSSNSELLQAASGQTDVAVLVDRNLDGVINSTDFGADSPLVEGMRPGATDFPVAGVRAGCLFYCASPGATTAAPHFILSWK